MCVFKWYLVNCANILTICSYDCCLAETTNRRASSTFGKVSSIKHRAYTKSLRVLCVWFDDDRKCSNIQFEDSYLRSLVIMDGGGGHIHDNDTVSLSFELHMDCGLLLTTC